MSEPTSPTADAVETADQAVAAEAGQPVSTPPPPPDAAVAPPAKAEAPCPAARPTALPPYTRSLLHIQVPVVVTLARKRQALGRIVELGPGSIIQFENRARTCWNFRSAIVRLPAARPSRSATSSACASSRSPCPGNVSVRSKGSKGLGDWGLGDLGLGVGTKRIRVFARLRFRKRPPIVRGFPNPNPSPSLWPRTPNGVDCIRWFIPRRLP